MNNEITILYADNDLIVVNKPPQLLSVPGRGEHKQDCLVARLQTDYPGARIVHRLDCDTSGIMVLAMHAESHRRLSKQFEQRLVDKTYIARVQGHLPTPQGAIDLPLALDWHNRPVHKVDFIYGNMRNRMASAFNNRKQPSCDSSHIQDVRTSYVYTC